MTRRLFLLAALASTALYAEDFAGKVVAISDGDTIRVMHNGASERIRLWGIDCPEVKQPFGTRAKQFTGDPAFGQVVTVKVRDIDRYKRTVAEIILSDGRNLNHEIVRAGFAWWYRQYARHGLPETLAEVHGCRPCAGGMTPLRFSRGRFPARSGPETVPR